MVGITGGSRPAVVIGIAAGMIVVGLLVDAALLISLMTIHALTGWPTTLPGLALAVAPVLVPLALIGSTSVGLLRRAGRALEEQAAELRDSRARVVRVADDTRRRIERDLHDGVQQDLLAIAVGCGNVRSLLDAGQLDAARRLVQRLGDESRSTLADLRALAKGVFPPALESGGLNEALVAAATRSPIDVTLDITAPGRYPPHVEAAVYFVCVEALHNATKHGGPSVSVELSVTLGAGVMRFRVADDGSGFDPAPAGDHHGLAHMADRVLAAGGELCIDSRPGRGTVVAGCVPVADWSVPRREIAHNGADSPVGTGIVGEVELAEHGSDVLLDGTSRHEQLLGDRSVGAPGGDELEHLSFPFGESVKRRVVLASPALDEMIDHQRIDDRSASVHLADGIDELAGVGDAVLEQVGPSRETVVEQAHRVGRRDVLAQHHHAGARSFTPEPVCGL